MAKGDLSKKITVDAKGELLELKNTINTMVDQLNSFGSEVTRVALEVGTEGRLGGQATVKGVGGVWKDLTDSVNQMASNLTGIVRNIADVTTSVANGDLSKKITVDVKGEMLELKNTINTMVDQLNSFGSGSNPRGAGSRYRRKTRWSGESTRSRRCLERSHGFGEPDGRQPDGSGQKHCRRDHRRGKRGDLSQKITVDAKGELLELKNTINTMVDQLNSFSSEVTCVAREVGSEGQLGGQANVPGVGGTWKDLTDSCEPDGLQPH